MPSLKQLVGLTVCVAGTGCYAAAQPRAVVSEVPTPVATSTADRAPVTVFVGEGELEDIEELDTVDARARAKHSLTTWEWNHLKRVSNTYKHENYRYVASNFGATDEYSVIPGDSDECLVLIAATDSVSEWISNVNFPFSTLSYGNHEVLTAHSGFVNAAVAMHNDGLLDKIQNNCGSRDVVTFAGHSRGGGIAQVLSSWYNEVGLFNTVRMLSWGSPRSFTDSSADRYHKSFYQVRVVNDNDIITRNPTRHLGYKHFGTVVCLDCKSTSQDSQADFSLNLLNHLMFEYNWKIQSISA
eukprot:CFRG2181T1